MQRTGSVVLLLLVFCSPEFSFAQDLVIGYTARADWRDIAPRGEEVETALAYELCVTIHSGTLERGQTVTVTTVYVGRRAEAGKDYVDQPVDLVFTNTSSTQCFNITIIDDDIHENNEELFINLTTTAPAVTLDPHFFILTIEDEDITLILWEESEYTVPEQQGQVNVCAIVNEPYEVTIPIINIQLIEGTAQNGIDYRRNKDLFNFVPDGVKRTQKQCANIEIIPDIEFEGTKSFELFFDLIPTPRINVGPNARVVIIDYNVIVQQQPESVCNGLENLINTTLPDNVNCSTFPDDSVDCIVECSTPEIDLLLAPSPCNQSIRITINNGSTGNTLLNANLSQSQELTTSTDYLNVSVQVVSVTHRYYYIFSLETSLELELPSTAIPLNSNNCTTYAYTMSELSYIYEDRVISGTTGNSTALSRHLCISLLLFYLLYIQL